MSDINMVLLTGRLTRDPESREAGESTVCQMGLAVNESWKDGNDWKERPTFIDVVVWGRPGDACATHLSKGSPVTVRGRLRSRSWETDDGAKRSKLEIVADQVVFHSRPKADEDAPF